MLAQMHSLPALVATKLIATDLFCLASTLRFVFIAQQICPDSW